MTVSRWAIERPRAQRRRGRRVRRGLLAVGLLVAGSVKAQPARVPIRDLGPVVATAKDSLGVIFGVWQFADGRVLVNDGSKRRLMLFDSTLSAFEIVADTLSAARIRY